MQNALKSISFRFAAKLEHPNGVPLAGKYGDFGVVLNGMLRLTFDPPMAHKHSISVGCFGGVNGTRDAFSGTLETGFAGDVFAPSKSLVSSVKTMVQKMAEEMSINDEDQKTVVLEEILSAITIHVPVRQIYEKIMSEFPVEYRAINLDYKRRNGVAIDEDMYVLISKQQRQFYHFASLKNKIALFSQNDLVKLDDRRMDRLYRSDPQTYEGLMKILEGVNPINDAYVVFRNEDNHQVFLVGKDKSKQQYVRTEKPIPTQYLQEMNTEEDEEFTEEEKEDFGLGEKNEQKTTQQPRVETKEEKDNKLYAKTIIAWAKKYAEKINQQGQNQQFKNPKGTIRKVKLDPNGIPSSVYNNRQSAMQYKDKIIELYNGFFNRKFIIADPFFLALHEYLTQS